MQNKNLKNKLAIVLSSVMIGVIGIGFPLIVQAEKQTATITVVNNQTYKNGHIKDIIEVTGIPHTRTECIEFGKTFRNKVSDLYNLIWDEEGTLTQLNPDGGKTIDQVITMRREHDKDGVKAYDYITTPDYPRDKWLGWGAYSYNETHTEAIAPSTSNSPSGLDSDENTTNTKEAYSVKVVSWNGDFTNAQQHALSLIEEYTTNEFTKQVLSWAVQNEYILASGTRSSFHVVFSDKCDSYVLSLLKEEDEIRAYKEFVWKVSNIRQSPSFSQPSSLALADDNNIIHLKYDATVNGGQGGYTATVADENGMMKYFNFAGDSAIPGCNVTQNENGTITITTKTKEGFSNVRTNQASVPKSTLLPDDCKFPQITFWHWEFEVKSGENPELNKKTFTYSWQDPNDSHNISWKCEWTCVSSSTEYCEGEINDHDCTSGCYTDRYGVRHHTANNKHSHRAKCYHSSKCTHASNTAGSKFSSYCSVSWTCERHHITINTRSISGHYRNWQDLARVHYDDGKTAPLVDPVYAYVAVVCDPHEFEAKTDTEVLLVADNASYNTLTYTYDDGTTIKYADHIRPNEKYKLVYIYSYRGSSKGMVIKKTTRGIPYYKLNYKTRMDDTKRTESVTSANSIYMRKDNGSYHEEGVGTSNEAFYQLDFNLTNVTMRGFYSTIETPYVGRTYTYDSSTSWNSKIKIDALKTSDYPEVHRDYFKRYIG